MAMTLGRASLQRATLLAATAAVSMLALCTWSGVASAAPGVPQDPTTIYAEDFEHGVSNTAVPLESYVGPPPVSMTYTAHPDWLDTTRCNGIIASFNTSAANGTFGCGSDFNSFVRGLAEAMGAFHGTGGDDHVLADTTVAPRTNATTPAPTFQTESPIPLTAANRYVSFSVDVAVKCNLNFPKLRFFLLDGGTEIPAFGAGPPSDPCTDPGGQVFQTSTGIGGVEVGTHSASRGILFSGSTAGLKLTNDQSNGFGNDYAIDRIRMLDATPSLDKSFTPQTIPVGGTSTLTFTVTNTSELGEKAGWSFTDELIGGLSVAGEASSDCTNALMSVPPGGNTIKVSGDLAAGQASCTVSVPVKPDGPGSYPNGPDQVSTVGLDESEQTTTLTVMPAVQVSIGDVVVKEGDTGLAPPTPATLRLTLDAPSKGGVSVAYGTVDGTATAGADYVPEDGTVTFAPGETSRDVVVDVNGDLVDEPNEQFEVLLFQADGASIEDAEGTVTILDDDRNGRFSCRATALRLGSQEPLIGVANPPGDPCRDDSHGLLRVTATGPMTSARTMSLEQRTNATPDDANSDPQAGDNGDAQSRIQDAVVEVGSTTITVDSAFARSTATCPGDGQPPVFSSQSTIGRVLINGILRATVRTSHFDVPVPGGTLHFNHTISGRTFRTQRAVWFESSTPLLPDVVVGEATSDYHGNPCAN